MTPKNVMIGRGMVLDAFVKDAELLHDVRRRNRNVRPRIGAVANHEDRAVGEVELAGERRGERVGAGEAEVHAGAAIERVGAIHGRDAEERRRLETQAAEVTPSGDEGAVCRIAAGVHVAGVEAEFEALRHRQLRPGVEIGDFRRGQGAAVNARIVNAAGEGDVVVVILAEPEARGCSWRSSPGRSRW